MARKCFISFKTEDAEYKESILNHPYLDIVNKSLKEPIDSEDEEYIMQKIRSDYLADSTVTIFLIGERSSEVLGYDEQKYIKRELQGSLYDSEKNPRNGILGIVLPAMYNTVYCGQSSCVKCGLNISLQNIGDQTMIKEFHYNYHLPTNNNCHWGEDDRYCILVKWDDFWLQPNMYIEQAFEKRNHPISKKVKVYP